MGVDNPFAGAKDFSKPSNINLGQDNNPDPNKQADNPKSGNIETARMDNPNLSPEAAAESMKQPEKKEDKPEDKQPMRDIPKPVIDEDVLRELKKDDARTRVNVNRAELNKEDPNLVSQATAGQIQAGLDATAAAPKAYENAQLKEEREIRKTILEKYGNIESNIPTNSIYWKLRG